MTGRPVTHACSRRLSVAARRTTIADVRVSVDVSVGELIDRITILQIKTRRLPRDRRADARRALAAARSTRDRFIASSPKLHDLTRALRAANRELWDVEEELRTCERTGRFGPRFVKLARSVYKTNDRRAALKRALDRLLGSDVREQKSYRLPAI